MARTKEYRRFITSTKLEKRIKMYSDLKWWKHSEYVTHASYRENVLKGNVDQFLKNTAVACSCYSCSGYYKYNRISQSEICKIIKDQLD